MKTVYMFVGVPGSGKSTFFEKRLFDCAYISSDDVIDNIAMEYGMTYDEIFKDAIGLAQKIAERTLRNALECEQYIVWDQTNLTVAGRSKKLVMIPNDWKVVAIWFPVPEPAEWKRRLASRPGKTIPPHVLENMVNTFVVPTVDEGFDEVYRYDEFEE